MEGIDSDAPRVLLVDDAPANLVALAAVLAPLGAVLVRAGTGQEAVELVEQNWFAAVLIDVQMPVMDGFETTKRIRATERGREVPIIFLTAIHRDEAYSNRGYGIGAADYITKPFDPAVVRARVKAFVDLYRQRDRQRRLRLEASLNYAPALVAIFRARDHVCEFANVASLKASGREVVGRSARELGASPEMLALLDAVTGNGEPLSLTEHRVPAAHAERFLNLTLQPLRGDQGEVEAVVVFAIDVTETVASRRTLEEARARAEHASRVKDEFLALVSHELRTPLSSIVGWTARARRQNESPDVDRALTIVERNARAQARLIDDLLDASRVVVGQLRLEFTDTPVKAAVEGALEALRPTAEAKGVVLASTLGEPGIIEGDPERLQQVIWNLVSNAIKFTPSGGRVDVQAARLADRVVVRVTDTGEGLDAGFIPHLFEPFRQGDASTTRRHGGLGLGLAIANQIVRGHGGTLAASSEGKGRGATMVVELPLRAAAAPDGANVRSAAPARLGPSMAKSPADVRLDNQPVLVVDDDEDTRLLLNDLFADRGATVTCVSNARDAMAQVRRGSDVIVSDIGMPGMDGYTLIRNIRRLSSEDGGGTPAIALTAYSRPEDALRAVAAGYQLHASKPVNGPVLLASVAALAARKAAIEGTIFDR
jgi:signal transduction histidine kinase